MCRIVWCFNLMHSEGVLCLDQCFNCQHSWYYLGMKVRLFLLLPCLLLSGCLGATNYYGSSGAAYSTATLNRYNNSTTCSVHSSNPFAKGYVQNTNPFAKGYVQTTNRFAKGYVQDTNPFADGYVQDTNPFADGYIQDKCLIGLDHD